MLHLIFARLIGPAVQHLFQIRVNWLSAQKHDSAVSRECLKNPADVIRKTRVPLQPTSPYYRPSPLEHTLPVQADPKQMR